MNLIDCHTHTQYSMDSEADIREMISKAIELGLAAYAITDHCECSTWYPESHYTDTSNFDYFNYAEDFNNSLSAVTALKEKYPGFNLICGIEMGQATQDIEVARKIISDERLDFIIGSMHQLQNEKDFYYIDYENMSMDEIYNLLERYFNEIYNLCKMDCFDVLGHLTYCLRYMKCRNGINPDISRFDDIIVESFRLLVQNGRGIEINTSGLRQGFGAPFPDLKYVKMFRDMGGEILSIGSDAHCVEDIGKNISDAREIAIAAGFSDLCYFKKRKPQFIRIA